MEWIVRHGELIGFGLTFAFGLLIIWVTKKEKQDEDERKDVQQKVSLMRFVGLSIVLLSFAILARYFISA